MEGTLCRRATIKRLTAASVSENIISFGTFYYLSTLLCFLIYHEIPFLAVAVVFIQCSLLGFWFLFFFSLSILYRAESKRAEISRPGHPGLVQEIFFAFSSR